MKKIIGLFIILFMSVPFISIGQMDEIEAELRILYADEEYEKCANKALKLADKKEKNNPIVYLYASKAALKISQIHELSQEYPKAFKDALKYAGKYRKKDDNGKYYDAYLDHFEELKKIVYNEVGNLKLTYTDDKEIKGAKKSVGLLKRVNKFDPYDQGAWLMRGLMEVNRKNRMEGKQIIKRHMEAIQHLSMDSAYEYVDKRTEDLIRIKPFKKMSTMEQKFLQKALMMYADYLSQKDEKEEALAVMNIGKPFFYNENEALEMDYSTDFKRLYLQIERT